MKRWIVGVLFMLGCAAGHAGESKTATKAAQSSEAKTAQQQKMKGCNVEAKTQELKGDARKQFMSKCLKKSDKTA